MARVSGYNYHCNDVNGKFGTAQTATGIPISDTHYTIAVPMTLSRTPYRKGDVVMVRNDKNDTSALYLVTDVGGMPHADIDIVEGVGLKALGIEVTAGGGDKGVSALSQKNGFTTKKVGSFDYSYGDAAKARPLQELLVEINKGEKELSALTEIDGFITSIGEEELSQTLSSYAPDIEPDVLNSGNKDYQYANYDPERRRRTEEDMTGYINQLMQNGEMAMALFMILAFIFMGEDAKGLFDTFFGQNTGPGRAGGGVGSVGSYEYNNKGAIGGERDGYEFKHPEYKVGEEIGEYFARVAKSYVGQKEVGNNGGKFVEWLGLSGLPWCAGFTSKIYEGTGLFNFETFALKIAAQGTSTGSYVNGISGLNNIEVGDAIIFDRKASNDEYGHIGTVVEVHKDGSGNVTGVTTVEGNSGDKVSENYHSVADLKDRSRYLGHVDISHREEALGIDIEQKLLAHYHPDVARERAAEAAIESGEGAKFVVNIGHNAWYRTERGSVVQDTGAETSNGLDEVEAMRPIAKATKNNLLAKGYHPDNVLVLDMGNREQMLKLLPLAGYTPAEIAKMDDGTKIIFPNKLGEKGECYARAKISEAFLDGGPGGFIRLDFDARGAGRPGAEAFYQYEASSTFTDHVYGAVLDGGVKGSNGKVLAGGPSWDKTYSTLRYQQDTPAVIVELGNGENAQDRARLNDPAWRAQQGRKLAEGLDRYAESLGVSAQQVRDAKEKAESEQSSKEPDGPPLTEEAKEAARKAMAEKGDQAAPISTAAADVSDDVKRAAERMNDSEEEYIPASSIPKVAQSTKEGDVSKESAPISMG